MNFWTGTRPEISDGTITYPANALWVNSGSIGFSYGITNNISAFLDINLYEDTNLGVGNGYNLPNTIELGVKGGNFYLGSGSFRYGFNTNLYFCTGDFYDYYFVPYNPGSFQFGLGGLLSYYLDPYLPSKSVSVHLNAGYWAYNDAGQRLRGASDKYSSGGTSALTYGFGLNIPVDMFDLVLETSGRVFISPPDSAAFGFENYLYVTPGFKYYPLNWLTVNFGVDLLVVGSEDKTVPMPNYSAIGLPNYATWKVQMGVDIKILPVTQGMSETQYEKKKFNDKVQFFENVIEERQKTENIEDELEKLKQQRKQAERDLEELRQLLDEQD
jgi:hypothetical protein